jgi:hypothetical protein
MLNAGATKAIGDGSRCGLPSCLQPATSAADSRLQPPSAAAVVQCPRLTAADGNPPRETAAKPSQGKIQKSPDRRRHCIPSTNPTHSSTPHCTRLHRTTPHHTTARCSLDIHDSYTYIMTENAPCHANAPHTGRVTRHVPARREVAAQGKTRAFPSPNPVPSTDHTTPYHITPHHSAQPHSRTATQLITPFADS